MFLLQSLPGSVLSFSVILVLSQKIAGKVKHQQVWLSFGSFTQVFYTQVLKNGAGFSPLAGKLLQGFSN